jgi:UDP-N-acetylmuramyl pentapeptide phosphotransferase/UDP-N-acetylglucosamine-1-phosphate transferase
VLGIAVVLAFVSWIDDIRGLPAFVRLAAQAVCVAVSLYLLPLPLPAVLDTLPPVAQYLIIGLAWLWFINLYNFMDGIDGITGVETLTITLGTAAVLGAANGGQTLIAPALVIAAAMPGFLKWNWPPAKIFMGDVGSVTLGYLLGWLLIASGPGGSWSAALIIPGYYLADATATLIRRAIRGEKVWQAHRQHAYQQALQNGISHGDVSGRVGVLGVCLIGLALAALHHPVPAAVVLVGAMMHHFTHKKS